MSQNPSRTHATWRSRIGLPLALTGLVLAWTAVGTSLAADANDWGLTGSQFQTRDGNTRVETAADVGETSWGTKDWDGLNTFQGTAANASTALVQVDQPSGSGDDSFGNGTKEDTPVPSVVAGSIPPNKSDLLEFGSWVERNADGQFLHLFWSRVQEPSGTTNMDFELNAKTCPTVASGKNRDDCSANGVTPTRSTNDLLITYDLARGGTTASIGLKKWDGSQWVADSLAVDKALGSINSDAVTSTLTGRTYSARTFGEASIDLSEIFVAGSCSSLGSAYLKSRSSDSFTSAVKDFVRPAGVDISNCGRLVLLKTDGTDPLDGAAFTISPANQAGTTQMTDLGGGRFCIDKLFYGTAYAITESTTPGGYDGDDAIPSFTPTEASNAGACSTVTATTPPAVTVANERLLGSLLVTKVDPAGALLGGAAFSYTSDDDATVTGTVTATSVAGVHCVDDLVPGSYTISETTPPAGYSTASNGTATVTAGDDCATRIADAQEAAGEGTVDWGENLEVTDNPAPGTINVSKSDDDGGAMAGIGFTLYVDADTSGTWETTETTLGLAQQLTGADGTTSFASVPLGSYCVVETLGRSGYAVAAPRCVTVGLGTTSAGQTTNLEFTNTQLHKVIVLVCHQGTATLVAGTASTGPGSTDDVTTAVTGDLPGGVTGAQLCGLPGTSGLSHTSDPTVSVDIPSHQ